MADNKPDATSVHKRLSLIDWVSWDWGGIWINFVILYHSDLSSTSFRCFLLVTCELVSIGQWVIIVSPQKNKCAVACGISLRVQLINHKFYLKIHLQIIDLPEFAYHLVFTGLPLSRLTVIRNSLRTAQWYNPFDYASSQVECVVWYQTYHEIPGKNETTDPLLK